MKLVKPDLGFASTARSGAGNMLDALASHGFALQVQSPILSAAHWLSQAMRIEEFAR